MTTCKENVIEIIDGALWENKKITFCTCQYRGESAGLCSSCKINLALKMSRACIVASVDRIDVLRSNFIAVQVEIESKLRTLLKEG